MSSPTLIQLPRDGVYHRLRSLRSGGRRLGARNARYMDFATRLCRFLCKVDGVEGVVLAKNCCGVRVTLHDGGSPQALDQVREVVNDPPCCGNCHAFEGDLHKPWCKLECCPFCQGQLISCDCAYEQLEIDCGPDSWAFEHGLTDEQAETWEKLLDSHGRVPYVHLLMMCVRCGKREPDLDFFMVDDWHNVVPPVGFPCLSVDLQKRLLCSACFGWLKQIMPNGWKASTE